MSSKSLACLVTVGQGSGAWGSCGLCATVRLVSSAKPTGGRGGGRVRRPGNPARLRGPGGASREGTGRGLLLLLGGPHCLAPGRG